MNNYLNASGPSPVASELNRLDVKSLTAAYRNGQLSPVEITQATLDRAAEIQAALNPFSFLDPENALEAARAAERRWAKGEPLSPIDGIPTTLKDIVHVERWAVRYGSLTTDPAPLRQDAPSVARLRKAGAIFIGQTTTPEFGWKAVTDSPAFGVTRNPWDPARSPGGSSGGAAVAAACGAGVLHLGTDGGGSIRIPASFTGIVGHKPSYGRVAAHPLSSFGTVAHIGPMTRTVGDAAAMLDIMSGRDLRDWTQAPVSHRSLNVSRLDWRGKRIAYWKEPCVGKVDFSVGAAIEGVLKDLEDAGASIAEIRLPDQDTLLEVFYRHWYVGAANRLSSIDPARWSALDPGLLHAASVGQGYSGVERMAAEICRARFGAAMDGLLAEFDFVVSPTVPILPFEAGHQVPPGSGLQSWVEWSSFSFPINLSQQPASTVPCGLAGDGLPIGMQIIGARGADEDVLRAALSYEEMYPHRFLNSNRAWPCRSERAYLCSGETTRED
ncbi:amidase [Phyllobacterium sophorae]|uniref:Amidase n=1 Tax=Phyllobacterium sophorae TaxID=1520277 RepID=A0A2P7AN75_9HYPH|nr:amidase [Phyllobacterium sophorae]PSH55635.1 amidase [Phyllobacterium sophorae]